MRRITLLFTSLLIAGTAMAGQLTIGDWDFMGLDCFPTEDNTVNLGWTLEYDEGAGIEVTDVVIWDHGQYDLLYTGGGILTVRLHGCPDASGAEFECDLPDDILNHWLQEVVVEMPTTFCDWDCPDTPIIEVPAYSHDFGTVTVGESADWELVISSIGNVDLVVDDVVSDNAVFTEDFSGPQSVAPGTDYSVFVTFSPDDAVSFSGTLTITSNADESPLVIDLAGMGAAGDVPDIDVDPMMYDFGAVEVGLIDAYQMTISNDGNADLVVSSIAATPAAFTTNFSGEVTIAPAASESYVVTFSPTEEMEYEGSLTITNNDQEIVVPLYGEGGEPDIFIPQNNHDFGEVMIGESVEWTCTVLNNGNVDLIITETYFQLPVFDDDLDLPATVVPDGSLDFMITFSPDASAEVFNTQMQIYTNDPADPTMVFLSGTAVAGDPPTAFALLTPENGASIATLTETLTWEESTDPDGGDVTYTLFVSPSEDFGHVDCDTLFDLTNTSYEVMDLEDDMTYYWRVWAIDDNSWGTFCDEDFNFSTYVPEPPTEFDLVAPPDGQNLTLPEDFFWMESWDPDPGDVVSYLFEVMDSEMVVIYDEETSETSLTLSEDLGPGTYYWTVTALDTNTDGTPASETWEFNILDSVSPEMGIPVEFNISSIYPNPFNPQVNIVFGVPQPANVTATIFDLNGRKVADLHPGLVQPGYHEMSWRPTGASGVYFLQMRADNGWNETRRLLYLK